MAKTTDKPTSTTRDKVLALKEHHKKLFEKEGVNAPKFVPRMCYPYKGENVISFFDKEIFGGSNIYTEFVSRDYESEDSSRTLWKWIYNPEYKTEYEKADPHPVSGNVRYIIPAEELINVTETWNESTKEDSPPWIETTSIPKGFLSGANKAKPETPSTKQLTAEFPEEDDVNWQEMTIKDYAAIQWKTPVSDKKWLNELIKSEILKQLNQ